MRYLLESSEDELQLKSINELVDLLGISSMFLPKKILVSEDLEVIKNNLIDTKSEFDSIKSIFTDADDDHNIGGYDLSCIKPYGLYQNIGYTTGLGTSMYENGSIFRAYIGLYENDNKNIKNTNTNRIYATADICKKLESFGNKIVMSVHHGRIISFNGDIFENYLTFIIQTK